MKQYLELLEGILENGVEKTDRTGTGTLSVFGRQLRFDLSKGFPLVTTRKINVKPLIYELLWFLKGSTNIEWLNENGVHLWDAWARDGGSVGPIYGSQWRRWGNLKTISDNYSVMKTIKVSHDQIKNVIDSIKTNPDSRRHIVSAWNVGELDEMVLPPCHYAFQFYVVNSKLSCMFQMRSTDAPVGLPYNLSSYALLTHMIAQVCSLDVGELIYNGGDVHIYINQIEGVKEQLKREPLSLPTLWLNPNIKDIDDFTYDDIKILNYNYHPHIKYPVAV